MDIIRLEKLLEKEPKFRLKQVKKAVFADLVENWEEVSTLPKNLRQKLAENLSVQDLKLEKLLNSKPARIGCAEGVMGGDGLSQKALFSLKDGLKIESVLMRHSGKDRNTVCVSSQVGCAMNCQFCATGQQGFKRNLTVSEITDQVLFFARLLKKEGQKSSNIVFMGMGEPFLNYENVMGAIKILNDKDGPNIGARHISISTAGITDGIEKLSKEPLQVNLAISLHAPDNELRSKLMPMNKIFPIEKILSATDNYIKKTKRRVMFEYLMISETNDSPQQAREMARILKNKLCFVNLISFNPVSHSEFKPSSGQKIKAFKNILEKSGVSVTQRYRFGKEIKAACGQLAG